MNGLAIFEKTDKGTSGFYIDQETIEFARLNALTKKRIAKSEAEKQTEDMKCHKAEKMKGRYRYRINPGLLIKYKAGQLGL